VGKRRTKEQVAADKELLAKVVRAIETNPAAVARALDLLFENQTAAEQSNESTEEDNGVGFAGCDARTGSWLVKTVLAEGRAKGRPEGELLRGKALQMGRRIALRYAKTQIFAAAKAKAAPAPSEAPAASEAPLDSYRDEHNRNETDGDQPDVEWIANDLEAAC